MTEPRGLRGPLRRAGLAWLGLAAGPALGAPRAPPRPGEALRAALGPPPAPAPWTAGQRQGRRVNLFLGLLATDSLSNLNLCIYLNLHKPNSLPASGAARRERSARPKV